MIPTIWLLIGPKGAGKTHIGRVIHAHRDVHFLSVEPVWMALSEGEDGWAKVAEVIDELTADHTQIMIESLGVGRGFESFHHDLAARYRLRYVRVQAPPKVCLLRVANRDDAEQLDIPLERVAEYNRRAMQVDFAWEVEIDNSGPATDEEILSAFDQL